MKFLNFLILAFLVSDVVAASLSLTNFDKAEWSSVEERNEIQVETWDVPDTAYPAFKAVGKIDAPIEKVMAIVANTSRRSEWTPNLTEAELIRHRSKTEWIERWKLSLPLIEDREIVFLTEFSFDPIKHSFQIPFHSITDVTTNSKDLRAWLHGGFYHIWPTDSGEATMVEYAIHLDLRGSVPTWLASSGLKDYPRKAIQGLRKQVKKSDVLVSPKIPLLSQGKARLEDVVASLAR